MNIVLKRVISFSSLFMVFFLFQNFGKPNQSKSFNTPKLLKHFKTFHNTPCRATNWKQLPKNQNYFIGRIIDRSAGVDCESLKGKGQNWTLAIAKMDLRSGNFNVQKVLKTMPATLGNGKRLRSIYDPSIIFYQGEYWIAFECFSVEIKGTASSCMAPMNIKIDGKGALIDAEILWSRSFVVVQGVNYFNNPGIIHSASTPMLFNDGGKVYLYWNSIEISLPNISPTKSFKKIVTRGIELIYHKNLKTFRAKGVNSSKMIAANHPRSTVVFSPESPESFLGYNADMRAIKKIGKYYYFLGSVGNCTFPLVKEKGCYRLVVRRSKKPFGNKVFNSERLPEGAISLNPSQYFSFATVNKKIMLLGMFLNKKGEPNRPDYGKLTLYELNRKLNFVTPNRDVVKDPYTPIVENLYESIMQEQPSRGQLRRLLSVLYKNGSFEDVAKSVLLDHKFVEKYSKSKSFGSTMATAANTRYIKSIYEKLLLRSPGKEISAKHVNTLNAKRALVLNLFKNSDEFSIKNPNLVSPLLF